MEQYGEHPMDLADASVIAAAESLRTTKVFTLDLADFSDTASAEGIATSRWIFLGSSRASEVRSW